MNKCSCINSCKCIKSKKAENVFVFDFCHDFELIKTKKLDTTIIGCGTCDENVTIDDDMLIFDIDTCEEKEDDLINICKKECTFKQSTSCESFDSWIEDDLLNKEINRALHNC